MANVKIPNFGDLITDVQEDDSVILFDSSGAISGHATINTLMGGWRDLRASILGAKGAGVNDPTLKAFGISGGIKQYAFAVNDEVYVAFHVDHDIKVGSTMYGHVHWSTDGTNLNPVKWEVEFMHTSRNDVTHDTFPAPTTVTIQDTPQGSAWSHIVTEDATGFAAPTIDSLILVHLTRITNGATDNTDDVFGLFMDIHYESQQYATPSRAPDFYTP